MRTIKKRTETTSETALLMVMRGSVQPSLIAPCLDCGSDVPWIAFSDLVLVGLSEDSLSDDIHIAGRNLCLRSLITDIGNGANNEK